MTNAFTYPTGVVASPYRQHNRPASMGNYYGSAMAAVGAVQPPMLNGYSMATIDGHLVNGLDAMSLAQRGSEESNDAELNAVIGNGRPAVVGGSYDPSTATKVEATSSGGPVGTPKPDGQA